MPTRSEIAVPLIRRVSLAILTLLASLWAGSLVVFGLVLVFHGVSDWISTSTGLGTLSWRLLGAALVCGGQFVFMFMVADRLFPRASRRPITWCCELGVVCIGLSAAAIALGLGVVQG